MQWSHSDTQPCRSRLTRDYHAGRKFSCQSSHVCAAVIYRSHSVHLNGAQIIYGGWKTEDVESRPLYSASPPTFITSIITSLCSRDIAVHVLRGQTHLDVLLLVHSEPVSASHRLKAAVICQNKPGKQERGEFIKPPFSQFALAGRTNGAALPGVAK